MRFSSEMFLTFGFVFFVFVSGIGIGIFTQYVDFGSTGDITYAHCNSVCDNEFKTKVRNIGVEGYNVTCLCKDLTE